MFEPSHAQSRRSVESRHQRIGSIDSLRGLAALSVVLFHYTYRYDRLIGYRAAGIPKFDLGHFSVELFFLISGFVIAGSLARTQSAGAFVVSRLVRLYPAFLACAAVTLCVVFGAGFNPSGCTLLSSVVGLSMLSSLASLPPIDPTHWTLTHEIAFYGLIVAATRVVGRERIETICALWLMTALAWTVSGLSLPSQLVVLLNLPFANLFVIGIILFRITAGILTTTSLLCLALAAAMTAFGPVIDRGNLGTGGYMVMIGLFSATLGAAAAGRLGWLEARLLVWLGAISYPLYLVHETLGFWLIRTLEARGANAFAAIAAAITLSIAIAAAVNACVERPIQARARRPSPAGLAGRDPPPVSPGLAPIPAAPCP